MLYDKTDALLNNVGKRRLLTLTEVQNCAQVSSTIYLKTRQLRWKLFQTPNKLLNFLNISNNNNHDIYQNLSFSLETFAHRVVSLTFPSFSKTSPENIKLFPNLTKITEMIFWKKSILIQIFILNSLIEIIQYKILFKKD